LPRYTSPKLLPDRICLSSFSFLNVNPPITWKNRGKLEIFLLFSDFPHRIWLSHGFFIHFRLLVVLVHFQSLNCGLQRYELPEVQSNWPLWIIPLWNLNRNNVSLVGTIVIICIRDSICCFSVYCHWTRVSAFLRQILKLPFSAISRKLLSPYVNSLLGLFFNDLG
jgi:hypothetical protein